MMVFQKAWRKGRKRAGGKGRRREARDLERRCWGMGRSVWKTQKKRPFQILRSSMVVKVRPEQR